MDIATGLARPLSFRPVYQSVVWGGRRLESWRSDLPEGPIGESWDISTQARGMSVVEEGPLAGQSLAALLAAEAAALVGPVYDGGDFPLLVKCIDANQRLSVQVHPDDALARHFGVGERGKTECWYMLGEGGELFQGLQPGTDAEALRRALAGGAGAVESLLQRFETSDGQCFFIPARTVHALGADTLLWEVQQSCDCTFRVYDWGRVGLDGRPRPLHVEESLATISVDAASSGPVAADWLPHADGGECRALIDCPYFTMVERRGAALRQRAAAACSIVINLAGPATVSTAAGSLALAPMRCCLVPYCAGDWQARSLSGELRLLISQPRSG